MYNKYIKRTKEINKMFGITTITFNGYFLGNMMFYIAGLFVTFFSKGGYSMQALFSDMFWGTWCILLTDLIATAVWNLKKSLEED